jgi:hypothetical protein
MQLLQSLITLNKSHTIIKTICETKSQWQPHEDVTYMNFSSIQSTLRDIIILWLKNVIILFIFILNFII